jgi:hypothetical protein
MRKQTLGGHPKAATRSLSKPIESVATILERTTDDTIRRWLLTQRLLREHLQDDAITLV